MTQLQDKSKPANHDAAVKLAQDMMTWAYVPEYNLNLAKSYLEAQARMRKLEAALEEIAQWAAAYPLDVFPEPDFAEAHRLLQAGGMSIDAISASNMRHVVEGVGRIARTALKEGPA